MFFQSKKIIVFTLPNLRHFYQLKICITLKYQLLIFFLNKNLYFSFSTHLHIFLKHLLYISFVVFHFIQNSKCAQRYYCKCECRYAWSRARYLFCTSFFFYAKKVKWILVRFNLENVWIFRKPSAPKRNGYCHFVRL